MSHISLRWVVNVLSFPSTPMQIGVWAVSNITFVLLSFAIIYTLNARSSVQMLALYSRRSVTLKRVNGDATSAVCRLRKYVSEALHAIPNCLWIHEMLVRNAMKQKLLLNQVHIVGLCSSIPMVVWCDHCLLVALWFRFHIQLAKCLLIRFTSSDLIPKCERQKTLRTRLERSGATHASLVYNRVVAWVVCKNLCFFLWHFVITVMSNFWRYLFVGIALMAWPRTWPVGSYHLSVSV